MGVMKPASMVDLCVQTKQRCNAIGRLAAPNAIFILILLCPRWGVGSKSPWQAWDAECIKHGWIIGVTEVCGPPVACREARWCGGWGCRAGWSILAVAGSGGLGRRGLSR